MKECTLGLIYVCKAIEFVAQTGWTALTIFEGLQFLGKLAELSEKNNNNEVLLTILVYVCMALAVF